MYGLTFLIPNINPQTALFLATGAPTISLLILGLSVVPQEVTQAKLSGRFDYIASLPVARLSALAADVTFWLLVQLPRTIAGLVLAAARFDLALNPNTTSFPVTALIALTAASVGYALALATPPQITQHLTQFITIGLLLFSPINFPIDRLPSILQVVHGVLPIGAMANLFRWSVAGDQIGNVGGAFAMLSVGCVAGLALSYRGATRRR